MKRMAMADLLDEIDMDDDVMPHRQRRKRPFFQNLSEECKAIVEVTKTKFRREQPESSASSVFTDDTHIIFYEAFLDYPIKLDLETAISPEKWAEAFLQFDLKSITAVLSEGVFTAEELKNRNENGNLPYTKKVAITRAAKCMMNKEQDPWTFKGVPWPNPHEMKEINKGFDEFNRVDGKEDIQPLYSDDLENCLTYLQNHQSVSISSPSGDSGMDDMMDVTDSSQSSYSDSNEPINLTNNFDGAGLCPLNHETQDEVTLTADETYANLIKNTKYPQILKKAMEHVLKNQLHWNSAEMAKKLTKLAIPQNTDVFVDAVQFSISRFAKAIQCDSIEEMAYVLFRKYLKLDFIDGCDSFDSLSAPKRLAIIRAVAWIRKQKNEGGEDFMSIDASKPGHNLFLNSEEVDQIRNYITYQLNAERNGSSSNGSFGSVFKPPNSFDAMIPPATKSNTCVVQPFAAAHSQSSPSGSTMSLTPAPPTPQNVFSPMGTSVTLQPPTDRDGNIVLREQIFKKSAWLEGLNKFKLDDVFDKAGKFLFDEVFTDDEIMNCNISGRKSQQKFSQNKIDAILEALAYMKCIKQRKLIWEPLTKSDQKDINKKVFTEHANYRRRNLKKMERL